MITFGEYYDRSGHYYPALELPSAIKKYNRLYHAGGIGWNIPADVLATGVGKWQHETPVEYIITREESTK